MRITNKWARSKLGIILKFVLLSIFAIAISACVNSDWKTASREPAGIAVNPVVVKEAVIEFYAADAFSWRGWFAVHTWLAIKPENAADYTVYEVVGWRVKRGLPALRQYQTTTPDRYWYGAKPEKFLSISGEKAKAIIPHIISAVNHYPWTNEYSLFPGPNSNTFPAWVGLQVPALELEMPFNAIGRGYADKK